MVLVWEDFLSPFFWPKKGTRLLYLKKNASFGGRGGVFHAKGFQFDMGPSWYLMPDIFEHFFSLIGEDTKDYFELKRLDPSYKIWFEEQKKPVEMTSDLKRDAQLFESYEPGVMKKINIYLKEAAAKYNISKNTFIYKPFNNVLDFFDKRDAVFVDKVFRDILISQAYCDLCKAPCDKKNFTIPIVVFGHIPLQGARCLLPNESY